MQRHRATDPYFARCLAHGESWYLTIHKSLFSYRYNRWSCICCISHNTSCEATALARLSYAHILHRIAWRDQHLKFTISGWQRTQVCLYALTLGIRSEGSVVLWKTQWMSTHSRSVIKVTRPIMSQMKVINLQSKSIWKQSWEMNSTAQRIQQLNIISSCHH